MVNFLRRICGMPEDSPSVKDDLDAAFMHAYHEHFEAGMYSRFFDSLKALYSINPDEVLDYCLAKMGDSSESSDTLCEVLKWATYADYKKYREVLIKIFVAGLEHKDILVRDDAVYRMYASIDVPTTEKYVKEAISRETSKGAIKDWEEEVKEMREWNDDWDRRESEKSK